MWLKIRSAISSFNWRLWLVLAVTLLIPAAYQTLRVFFLGDLPSEWGVNIASQLAWVNLLYEIVEEGLILPLFYFLGSSSGAKEELENKASTGLLFSGGIYAAFSLLVVIFAKPLCVFMASEPSALEATITYIRLESIASAIGILSKFLTVLLVIMQKERYMYLMLVIRTVLSASLDTFLVSGLPFSADIGVNGIAVSNIIVSVVCVLAAAYFLRKENVHVFRQKRISFLWLKDYGRLGLYSGLESFVRNIAYMLMISRLVNLISEQGTYWVANSFIWTWLLLPASALYDVVKKETAEAKDNIRTKTPGYFLIAALFSFAWFASIPLWKPFIRNVLNSNSVDTVFHIVRTSSFFYILYIFNCVLDGTIYGRGKTHYMLAESVFTNGIYYAAAFILWRAGIWVPTLTGITLLFGIGMAVDMIPTIGCYCLLLKHEQVRIKW